MVLGKFNRYVQKNDTRPSSYTTHKNKFKMDQRLKYQTQDHKNPRRKHRQQNIAHSNILLDISLQAKETKEKINTWDVIKLNTFCTVKEIVKKIKRQPTEWENIFTNDTSDKELVSKMYKELIQLDTKKNMQLKSGKRT